MSLAILAAPPLSPAVSAFLARAPRPAHLAVLRQTGSTRSLRGTIADLAEFNALLAQENPR